MHELISNRRASGEIRAARRAPRAEVSGDESESIALASGAVGYGAPFAWQPGEGGPPENQQGAQRIDLPPISGPAL